MLAKSTAPSGPSKMLSVVTENVVRCLDQPQCAALVTSDWTRAPNNDAAGGRCYRAPGKKLVVVIGQKKALHAQDTEAALVVVEGDALDQHGYFIGRGLAFSKCGVHGSESFLPGKRLAGVPIRKLILRGFVCGVRFASSRESHRSTRALGPS
jgi:hypothetical protein